MEIKVMEFTACRLLLLFRVGVLACANNTKYTEKLIFDIWTRNW